MSRILFQLPNFTDVRTLYNFLPDPVACNIGAGGSTSIAVIEPVHLTEPQGKIKNPQGKFKK